MKTADVKCLVNVIEILLLTASGGSTEVEQEPHHSKVGGSSPAAATAPGREKIAKTLLLPNLLTTVTLNKLSPS
jgi:hypothetical protein